MTVKKLVNNGFWSATSHLLTRGGLMVTTIILANGFTTSTFAAYSYFYITVSMLSSYAALGLGIAGSKIFAEANSGAASVQPVGTIWVFSVISGLAISGAALLLPPSLSGEALGLPKWALASGILALAMCVIPNSAVLGLEKYKVGTIVSALSCCIMLGGAYISSTMASVNMAIMFFIVATVVQALGNIAIVISQLKLDSIKRSFQFNKVAIRKVASYSIPMAGVSLLASSATWILGRIILAGEDGATNFAIFTVGMQWFSLVLFLPGIISRVFLPRLISLRNNEGGVEAKALTRVGTLMTLKIAGAVLFLGVLFSPILVKLYGGDLTISPLVLIFFMLAAVPLAPVNTLGNAVIANNGELIWLKLTVIWLLSIIAIGLAASTAGASAAAISQGASGIILGVLAVIVAKKKALI